MRMPSSRRYGPNLQVIAVTGGVGSGKSTVVDLMARRGLVTVRADDVAHKAILPGTPAHRRIVERFGNEILSPDGTIDRTCLADRVFGDPVELASLNAIVHPPVIEHLKSCFEEMGASGERVTVAVEIPLLVEAGLTDMVDAVILVTASPQIRMKRMVAQGWPEEKVRAVMEAQAADAEKAKHADAIIDNSGDIEALDGKVEEALAQIVDEARS